MRFAKGSTKGTNQNVVLPVLRLLHKTPQWMGTQWGGGSV